MALRDLKPLAAQLQQANAEKDKAEAKRDQLHAELTELHKLFALKQQEAQQAEAVLAQKNAVVLGLLTRQAAAVSAPPAPLPGTQAAAAATATLSPSATVAPRSPSTMAELASAFHAHLPPAAAASFQQWIHMQPAPEQTAPASA